MTLSNETKINFLAANSIVTHRLMFIGWPSSNKIFALILNIGTKWARLRSNCFVPRLRIRVQGHRSERVNIKPIFISTVIGQIFLQKYYKSITEVL